MKLFVQILRKLFVFILLVFPVTCSSQSRIHIGLATSVFNEPVKSDAFIPAVCGGANVLWRTNETKRFIPFVEMSYFQGAFVDRYLKGLSSLTVIGGLGVGMKSWGVFGAGAGFSAIRTTAEVEGIEFGNSIKTKANWSSAIAQLCWFTNRESRWQYGASVSKSIYGLVNFSQVTFSVRYRLNKDGGGE